MRYRNPVLLLIFVLSCCSWPCWAEELRQDIETKVVRVLATKTACYYHRPWKTPSFSTVGASGFFFKDEQNFPGMQGLILTNAHVVAMAESIKVSNGREKRRYNVRCIGTCHTADFAVLQMDPEDWAIYEKRNGKVVPLELGDSDTLRVGDKVFGWGYPLGGERLSKSEEGEINRIEVNEYVYSREYWLMVQASLQQNKGNSGGPVLRGEQVVGVASQLIQESDRINYFIPINLVKSLLPVLHKQDLIPKWRVIIQHMFPKLKEYYGLDAESGGVLVGYMIPDGGAYKFGLRPNDILLEIDGHQIDNFGDIFLESLDQKINFSEILNRKKVGDPLALKVLRQGQAIEIKGETTPGLPRLVPKVFREADYFIFGGIGFVELTFNCILNLGKSGVHFRAKYLDEFPRRPYEKIVIISEIFPEYGLMKSDSFLKRVMRINGEDVLNIRHLYEKIQALKEQGANFAMIDLAGNIRLPLDIRRADELDQRIKAKYGILYLQTPGGFSN